MDERFARELVGWGDAPTYPSRDGQPGDADKAYPRARLVHALISSHRALRGSKHSRRCTEIRENDGEALQRGHGTLQDGLWSTTRERQLAYTEAYQGMRTART